MLGKLVLDRWMVLDAFRRVTVAEQRSKRFLAFAARDSHLVYSWKVDTTRAVVFPGIINSLVCLWTAAICEFLRSTLFDSAACLFVSVTSNKGHA